MAKKRANELVDKLYGNQHKDQATEPTLDGSKIEPQVLDQAASQHKAWDERTNVEKLDAITTYQAFIFTKLLQKAKLNNDRSKVFWEKNTNLEDIDKSMPYNGYTGKPYTSLDGLLMRSVAAVEGYDKPIFFTMTQANRLGGVLKKELDEKGNVKKTVNGKDEYVKGIKVLQTRKGEFIPELDANGNKIYEPALDKDGNKILTQEGKEVLKPKGVWKEYERPILESVNLYHISQFDNIKMDKVKSIDMSDLQKKRNEFAKNSNKEYPVKFNQFLFKREDGSMPLGARVVENLRNYEKAAQTGRNFTPLLDFNATKSFKQEKSISR